MNKKLELSMKHVIECLELARERSKSAKEAADRAQEALERFNEIVGATKNGQPQVRTRLRGAGEHQ